jgi:hypothetical protein
VLKCSVCDPEKRWEHTKAMAKCLKHQNHAKWLAKQGSNNATDIGSNSELDPDLPEELELSDPDQALFISGDEDEDSISERIARKIDSDFDNNDNLSNSSEAENDLEDAKIDA